MSRKFKLTQRYAAFLLSAFIGIQACNYAEVFAKPISVVQNTSETEVENKETQNNARYLEVYFEINNIPEVISGEFFMNAMEKVSDHKFSDLKDSDTVKFVEAVRLAVIGANFEELALGYKQDKITDKVTVQINNQYAPYIACALDTGLINEVELENMTSNSIMSKEQAINLLMAVADANGKTRNFIGYTNESDIYGKLIKAREEAVLFENEKLQKIGEEAVLNGVTTGYNLLNSKYSANFIPELTLRYGHSTTTHALQLIGLLNSEGIVAKVQLEPKTSVFQYLPEWGDVPPATPDYRVEVISEEFMLANSLEYDLVFEFETEDDKVRFNELVEAYAKKDDNNKEGEGLLFASWWQPLYVSSVEMGEGYKEIYNNVITDGDYSLNPFCLPQDKEAVLKGFEAIDATLEVEQVKIWCNDAFYRYLTGESHQ
ncbi:MAG: hypothetical protein ACLRY5_09170 [Zhenhengia sp.]|jgi:hypothetical protein|nr:hypothetical protein [Niameybacter sp.]